MNWSSIIKKHLLNIPGFRTKRKLVIFESDDWGSIRMPSHKHFQLLINKNIRVDQSKFDSLDSLERKIDMEALFSILAQNRSSRGQIPQFTLNTVMGNPDFERIKQNSFNEFFLEKFQDSYQQYYGENNETLWKEGIDKKMIYPQFHAREHLNSSLWLKDLREGLEDTIKAFEHNFFAVKTPTSSPNQKHYLAAYHVDSKEELALLVPIIEDGLQLFKKSFVFESKSFIACNYVWPKELEPILKKNRILYLQGQRGQVAPELNKNKKRIYYHYTGQKNKLKQTYTVRNVVFEPYLDQNADWVNKTIKDIEISFRLNKPAIISTHRINYVSNMDIKNRNQSLKKLDLLLKKINNKWPEVEYLNSEELGLLINNHADSHS